LEEASPAARQDADNGRPPRWSPTDEGLSMREIPRCLKRYIAREVFAALGAPTALTNTA
jgi:hypothetical protein